eukprot:326385_1
MSTNIPAIIRWITLTECPVTNEITVPMGIDRNNYIVIDNRHNWDNGIKQTIENIYKYNIDKDKWVKIRINNLENINKNLSKTVLSAALDTNQQTLFLHSTDDLMQIQLNNNHISNHSHNIHFPTAISKSIVHNNSLFVFSTDFHKNSNSIWKWNSQQKTF